MLPQRKFVKGLNASTPIYNQPPGSFPRGQGLMLTKRGGLRVTDGSSTFSLLDGAVQPAYPINDILLVQINGVTPFYIAATQKRTAFHENSRLTLIPPGSYDLTTNDIGLLGLLGDLNPFPVRLLQFNGQVIITLGNTRVPEFWCGINSVTAPGGLGTWSAGTTPLLDSYILVASGPLNYVFQATAVAGVTGISAPSWNFTVGQTTADNLVTWTCLGQNIPQALVNQFQAVYPQWAASTQISANTIIQVGFSGSHPLQYWQAGATMLVGTIVIDSNNNIQTSGNNATTGEGEPIWNVTTLGITKDNGVTWTNNGPAFFYNFIAAQSGTTGAGPQPPNFSGTLNSTVPDGSVLWRNTGPTSLSTTPPSGAAAAIVYAGSLWVLNTAPTTSSDQTNGPTCLRMSELNNPNSWNPLNIAFLGKDDGTVGTGLATFTIAESGITPTGSLVAFKEYSTYQIMGIFGSDNFSIIQAQTDLGCIATATIQFLPGYGIARFSHLGPAIFDGVRDRLFGEELRPYFFGGEPDITPIDPSQISQAWAAQSVDPPMYILACGMPGTNGLTRLFCYDLILKAWATPIYLPWPIACIRQIRPTGHGLSVSVLTGGQADGSIRQLFGGAATWADTPTTGATTPVSWNVQTPEVFGKAAADKIYVSNLYVRGIGGTSGVNLSMDADTGTAPTQPMKLVQLFSGEFEAWYPFHILAKSVHAVISGSGPGEIHTFDWDAVPQPAAPTVLI